MTEGKRGRLYEKIGRVLAEIERIPKNGRNTTQGWRYATESDIKDFIRGKLAAHGIGYEMTVNPERGMKRTEIPTKNNGRTFHVEIWWDISLIDNDTLERATVLWPSEAMDSGDKALAKAETYATKTFIQNRFFVSSGDDPDTYLYEAEGRADPRNGNALPEGRYSTKKNGTAKQAAPASPLAPWYARMKDAATVDELQDIAGDLADAELSKDDAEKARQALAKRMGQIVEATYGLGGEEAHA